MEKVKGKPWADIWQELPFANKEDIVRQLVRFCSKTFEQKGEGIGNLFQQSDVLETASTNSDKASYVSPGSGFQLDRMVSTSLTSHVPNTRRGPFPSGSEWLSERLDVAEFDYCQRLLHAQEPKSHNESEQQSSRTNDNASAGLEMQDDEGTDGDKDASEIDQNVREAEEKAEGEEEDDDEEDEEDLENALLIITKLRNQLGHFFPIGEIDVEPSMLFHDDLNRHNILIDEDGALSAIVDWECVSFLPLSIACQYPAFLQGKPLEIEPIKSQYEDGNGEVAELYWEHLENYELTQLRRLFFEEMRRLQPGWVEVFTSSQRQRDFVLAVEASDDPFMIRRILSWLDDLESGMTAVPGLEERIDNATL